jgi:hypothetical protein
MMIRKDILFLLKYSCHLLEKKEKKRKEKKEFCPAPAGSKLTDKLRNKQFL